MKMSLKYYVRMQCIYKLIFLLLNLTQVYALSPSVHTLEGPVAIDQEPLSASKEIVNIYCYPGVSKNLLTLWQTVKFNLKIKNDEFRQYVGNNPQEVLKDYRQDSYGWTALNPFQKQYKSFSIELYNRTCMAINTKHNHTIELQVIRVDIWRVFQMSAGLILIFMAKKLSGNPLFFYICGILIGVFASFMLFVYQASKLLPKKTFAYGVLIGGWTVGVYILQQLWENIRELIATYQTYVFWYTLAMSFASFIICYRIGPPTDVRSQNIVMWILQCVGVLMIFLSSQYKEAATAIIVVSLIIRYFPQSVKTWILGYWHRRFPPKRRLLTNEEYYEEGARETKNALEKLREHCNSPDCHQWRIMLKLNDSQRFAKFVQGDSHLRDEEILDYEAYAFNLEKSQNSRSTPQPSDRGDGPRHYALRSKSHLEISDDESSSDSD